MNSKGLAITSAFIVVAMTVVAVLVGSRLPADVQLPIHWNIRGEADDFGGKWVALFMPIGNLVAAVLVLARDRAAQAGT